MNSWAITILPLFGVLLGATLQFALGRQAEKQKQGDAARSQAYADYLQAVAASAHLGSDDDLRDALRRAADAKARIAVYGTASVVRALAQFENVGAAVGSEQGARAFLSLVKTMRPGSEVVSDSDLGFVLFGTNARHQPTQETGEPSKQLSNGR